MLQQIVPAALSEACKKLRKVASIAIELLGISSGDFHEALLCGGAIDEKAHSLYGHYTYHNRVKEQWFETGKLMLINAVI
ncbi:MAG: hypothetical protein ACEY3J_04780 [Arsenophonus sp.]